MGTEAEQGFVGHVQEDRATRSHPERCQVPWPFHVYIHVSEPGVGVMEVEEKSHYPTPSMLIQIHPWESSEPHPSLPCNASACGPPTPRQNPKIS